MSGDELSGYDRRTFAAEGFSFPLFTSRTEGPGVILLHELPGLAVETKDFADWLAGRGFHVVMPLLFGKPLEPFSRVTIVARMFCIRREINLLSAGKSSPVTVWLRALCREVHGKCGGRGVGVIGMCLTGGFVLPMMVEPAVIAPVAAEPSLPFFNSAAVDVEPDVLRQAADRPDQVPLLGLRFDGDTKCRAERFQTINAALCGSARQTCPRFEQVIVPGDGHSTLTYHYARARERGCDTRERVFAFLSKQLIIAS